MEWIVSLVTATCAGIGVIIAVLYKRNQNKKDQYEHVEKLVEISSGQNEIKQDIKSLAEAVVKIDQNQRSTDIMLLRNAFLTIYFAYEKEKVIPETQYESACGIYDVYHQLGGNSFTTEKMEEMKTWKRI